MGGTIKGSQASQQGSNFNNKFQVIYPGVSLTISTSGSHQESGAFAANTSIVRLYCTQDVWIDIGPTPVATSSKMFLPANTVEYFGCNGADKVSALQVSSGGTLYITPGLA